MKMSSSLTLAGVAEQCQPALGQFVRVLFFSFSAIDWKNEPAPVKLPICSTNNLYRLNASTSIRLARSSVHECELGEVNFAGMDPPVSAHPPGA